MHSPGRPAQADSNAPAWKAYVDYVSGVVINGLSQFVIVSADQLLSQARNVDSHRPSRAVNLC